MSPRKMADGDRMARAASESARLAIRGEALEDLDYQLVRAAENDMLIQGIKIRPAQYAGGDTLITVTALAGGTKYVAFHAGSSVADAVVGLRNRLANGSLQWREDHYEAGRGNGNKGTGANG